VSCCDGVAGDGGEAGASEMGQRGGFAVDNDDDDDGVGELRSQRDRLK
jgi:hypothetical protein